MDKEDTGWTRPNYHVYDGIYFAEFFPKESLDKIKQFQFYPEDILLVTPPKAGTVWLAEIVWLLKNNIDVKTAKTIGSKQRIPTLEFLYPGVPANVDLLNDKPAGRIISSHLFPGFFDQQQLRQVKPKVIVLFRNPKDMLVSFYHLHRAMPRLGTPGSWAEFFNAFLEEKLDHGNILKMMRDWWKYKAEPNFLFLRYEDMKKDIQQNVEKIAAFLGESLTPEQVDTVVDYSKFENMKCNPSTQQAKSADFNPEISPYIRKGIIGDWKNYFTVAENEVMDALCKDLLGDSGIEFTYSSE